MAKDGVESMANGVARASRRRRSGGSSNLNLSQIRRTNAQKDWTSSFLQVIDCSRITHGEEAE